MLSFFESPTSFRLREFGANSLAAFNLRRHDFSPLTSSSQILMATTGNTTMDMMMDHDSHPDFLRLAGLVSEAVLEVVFVALPGFIVAASGMFDAKSQKFVAELNTMVFTPCLVFTKLASQLNADKLADLIIIPAIFIVQTFISWICAQAMARVFGFGGKEKKRQRNFILAMGVFGNSNSLPISLVLSLSKTIAGLHWDQVPGDNDDEVAARGILYLLVFQQLGQLLRWTWGYSVLLKPAEAYDQDARHEGSEDDRQIEEGEYRDDPDAVIVQSKPQKSLDSGFSSGSSFNGSASGQEEEDHPDIIPATPAQGNNISNEPATADSSQPGDGLLNHRSRSTGHITVFPDYSTASTPQDDSDNAPTSGWKAPLYRVKNSTARFFKRKYLTVCTFSSNIFRRLPQPVQKTLSFIWYCISTFLAGVWRQMNPPLWAMLAALIVASIPKLQHLFFDKGTFVSNSISNAIGQTGGVAVPLILVVLGANLARSTLPQDQLASSPTEKAEERKLLAASLLSRMLLPTIIMAPLLALAAKYAPVSILDDPIFIIVCFLLTGAPSALQLAQICQINNVYMGAMSNLLVASYVFAIFPSTLVLVMLALEVLEWAV